MPTGIKSHLAPFLGTCIIAGVILTILAPYGTHAMGLVPRATFWIGLCMAGGLGAGFVAYASYKQNLNLGPVAMTLWQSLGSTIFVSAFVIGLNYAQTGHITLPGTLMVIFYVWIISVTLSGIGNLVSKRQASAPEIPFRAALYERLKPALRTADIYALSAEDHYVRVHTSKGDDLILMRLSDASRETQPITGLSPHRSWWVAESGVKSVARKDGKSLITLHNGITVPVSRNRHKTLKEAGWV